MILFDIQGDLLNYSNKYVEMSKKVYTGSKDRKLAIFKKYLD